MEQPDRPKRSGWVFAVVAMFVLPLLYVLSAGPIVWLEYHGFLDYIPEPIDYFLDVVYTPLRMIYKSSPTFAALLNWYLWVCFGVP